MIAPRLEDPPVRNVDSMRATVILAMQHPNQWVRHVDRDGVDTWEKKKYREYLRRELIAAFGGTRHEVTVRKIDDESEARGIWVRTLEGTR